MISSVFVLSPLTYWYSMPMQLYRLTGSTKKILSLNSTTLRSCVALKGPHSFSKLSFAIPILNDELSRSVLGFSFPIIISESSCKMFYIYFVSFFRGLFLLLFFFSSILLSMYYHSIWFLQFFFAHSSSWLPRLWPILILVAGSAL